MAVSTIAERLEALKAKALKEYKNQTELDALKQGALIEYGTLKDRFEALRAEYQAKTAEYISYGWIEARAAGNTGKRFKDAKAEKIINEHGGEMAVEALATAMGLPVERILLNITEKTKKFALAGDKVKTKKK